MNVNVTDLLHAIRDRYAKRQGPFVITGQPQTLTGAAETWEFMRELGGKTVRIVYECLDGKVRDIIGRQGVYNSDQDGRVENVGHPMADAGLLTLSFWTFAHGQKVNTGTGKGYRTLRAAGILAIRVDETDYLTAYGRMTLELYS